MKILILLVAVILCCSGCSASKENAEDNAKTVISETESRTSTENNAADEKVLLELCSNEEELTFSTKKVEVNFINNSEQDILTGEAYTIESFRNDEWTEVPNTISYEDIGYTIAAGEEKKFICILDGISEKGLYRIKKSYSIDNKNDFSPTKYVYVEFQIENDF